MYGSPDVFVCVPSLSGEARGIDNSSVKKVMMKR